MRTLDEVRALLREALTAAMRAKDPGARALYREVLAALDDAEAADLASAPPVQAGVIAGGVAGLGAGDVARRALTPADVEALLRRELDTRRRDVETLLQCNRPQEAAALEAQAALLEQLVRGAG